MYHVFFIPSSSNGHLGCFQTLAVENNDAMNIRIHLYLELVFLFSLDKYPELGLLDPMTVLFSVF